MVSTGRAAQHYLQTQVRSRTPLELVVMLYDGALRSCAAARDAAMRRDIPARRAAVSKTMAIVNELRCSLDLDHGGEIAAELDRLYTWMTSRLMDATIKQEAAPLQEVHRVLEILRDGWEQISSGAPVAEPAP
jgi:flagellar protein FliS